MTSRTKLLAALVFSAALSASAYGGPGGNGNGNGGANGNGGNSADAGAQSQGHGAATSAVASDPATRGLEKAQAVVGTTPASPQALASIAAAISRVLGGDTEEGEPEEGETEE